jgi:DNA-directed RNA polymerase subunit beta'
MKLKNIMAANMNLLKPADGSPILHVEQDIVLGCYYLTYDRPGKTKEIRSYMGCRRSYDGIRRVVHWSYKAQFEFRSAVKPTKQHWDVCFFNEIFPEDFPFQNYAMTKKKITATLAMAYEKYGQVVTAQIADELKDIGFKYATRSGLSMGMDDFHEIVGLSKNARQWRVNDRSKLANNTTKGSLLTTSDTD